MLQCPKCNRIIMDITENGYKLRTRMMLFQDGKTLAICPTCKSSVVVPVLLGDVSTILPKQKLFINHG